MKNTSMSSDFASFLFSPSRTFWMVSDFVILVIFYYIFHWISPYGKWGVYSAHITTGSIVFAGTFCFFALGMGYYERTRRFSRYKILLVGTLAALLALPCSSAAVYFFHYSVFGRLTFLWAAGGSLLGLVVLRIALSYIYGLMPYRYTFFGSSALMKQMKSVLLGDKKSEFMYFSYADPEKFSNSNGIVDLTKMKRAGVSDVVFTTSPTTSDGSPPHILQLIHKDFRILHEIDFYSEVFERLPLHFLSKEWFLERYISSHKIGEGFYKRLFDVSVSLAGLIVAGPIMLMIAAAIKLTSPGNVIFIQPRQGRFNQPFSMYKFRTMTAASSKEDASGGFTKVADSRVTAVGKIIRPLHLDELPQLINIFLGHMSLVGPRPEALKFAEKMADEIPMYQMRYLVRPGLTGHAQIMCGYMLDTVEDTEHKLEFDLYYALKRNLILDLRICIRTFFIVLKSVLGQSQTNR